MNVVKYLIKHGADVNKATTDDDANPLILAAQQNHLNVVKCLIKNGADVNKARTDDGVTPLFPAAQNGHLDVVKYLIKHGADVNKAKTDGGTPFFIAAQHGHLDVVKCLVENGANVNKAITDGATPLFIAAQHGHLDVVECLVENSADVNKARTDGVTPLYIAKLKGHSGIEKVLVDKGAVYKRSNEEGVYPSQITKPVEITLPNMLCDFSLKSIQLVLMEGLPAKIFDEQITYNNSTHCFIDHIINDPSKHALFLQALQEAHPSTKQIHALVFFPTDLSNQPPSIKEGLARLAARFKKELFEIAIKKGCVPIIESLLTNYKTGLFNITTDKGDVAPLLFAMQNNHLEMVKCLLKHDGNVNCVRPEDNCNLLAFAAKHGDLGMVEFLVGKGLEVNHVTTTNLTPLVLAAMGGHLNVVQYLIEEKKVSYNQETLGGITAFTSAVENNRISTVRYLIKQGADIHKTNSDGKTALIVAVEAGHLNMVKYLIKKGADMNKAGKDGEPPLLCAARKGKTQIVEYLLKKLKKRSSLHKVQTTTNTDLLTIVKFGDTNTKYSPLIIKTAICEALINKYKINAPKTIKRIAKRFMENIDKPNDTLINEWIKSEDVRREQKLSSSNLGLFTPEKKTKIDEARRVVQELAAELQAHSAELGAKILPQNT